MSMNERYSPLDEDFDDWVPPAKAKPKTPAKPKPKPPTSRGRPEPTTNARPKKPVVSPHEQTRPDPPKDSGPPSSERPGHGKPVYAPKKPVVNPHEETRPDPPAREDEIPGERDGRSGTPGRLDSGPPADERPGHGQPVHAPKKPVVSPHEQTRPDPDPEQQERERRDRERAERERREQQEREQQERERRDRERAERERREQQEREQDVDDDPFAPDPSAALDPDAEPSAIREKIRSFYAELADGDSDLDGADRADYIGNLTTEIALLARGADVSDADRAAAEQFLQNRRRWMENVGHWDDEGRSLLHERNVEQLTGALDGLESSLQAGDLREASARLSMLRDRLDDIPLGGDAVEIIEKALGEYAEYIESAEELKALIDEAWEVRASDPERYQEEYYPRLVELRNAGKLDVPAYDHRTETDPLSAEDELLLRAATGGVDDNPFAVSSDEQQQEANGVAEFVEEALQVRRSDPETYQARYYPRLLKMAEEGKIILPATLAPAGDPADLLDAENEGRDLNIVGALDASQWAEALALSPDLQAAVDELTERGGDWTEQDAVELMLSRREETHDQVQAALSENLGEVDEAWAALTEKYPGLADVTAQLDYAIQKTPEARAWALEQWLEQKGQDAVQGYLDAALTGEETADGRLTSVTTAAAQRAYDDAISSGLLAMETDDLYRAWSSAQDKAARVEDTARAAFASGATTGLAERMADAGEQAQDVPDDRDGLRLAFQQAQIDDIDLADLSEPQRGSPDHPIQLRWRGGDVDPHMFDAGIPGMAGNRKPEMVDADAADFASEYGPDWGQNLDYEWIGPGGSRNTDDNPVVDWLNYLPDETARPRPWYRHPDQTEALHDPPAPLLKWYGPRGETAPRTASGIYTPRLSPFWQGADDVLAETFTFGKAPTRLRNLDEMAAEYWQWGAQGAIPGVDPEQFVASGKSGADLPGFSQYVDMRTASMPSGLDLAAVTAADVLVPGLATARSWDDSGWGGRAGSLALDAAGFVPAASLFSKGIRAGQRFGSTAGGVAQAMFVAPAEAIRHPIRATKSMGQLIDTIAGPRTIPVSALESTSTTMRLPVSAFVDTGYGFTDDLADVVRPGRTLFDDEAAKAAKAASDELTAQQIAGDAPRVQYGDLEIVTTRSPFQTATGPAVFSTGPDITPWLTGQSRDFVSAEGKSFFAPGYLSRFDARSAFGRTTPPGGQAGAAVIRDPAVLADLGQSGKTFSPKGPKTEVAEFESVLPQPYPAMPDVSQTFRVWSDPNIIKVAPDDVAEHVAALRQAGMNKQADRLLKDGEYSLGELRRLAVIDDPANPLTIADVYRLKAQGALENLKRLNPRFKAVSIGERAEYADDLLRQADVVDEAAVAARGDEAAALTRHAEDLRADAMRIRRELDDAERVFRSAADRTAGVAGLSRWAQGARGILTRDTSADVGRMALAGLTREPDTLRVDPIDASRLPATRARVEDTLDVQRVDGPDVTRIDAPDVPRVGQPTTGRIDAPDVPRVDAPDVPRVGQPATGRVAGEAPRVDVPGVERETPRVDVPGVETEAPRVDVPRIEAEPQRIDVPRIEAEPQRIDIPGLETDTPRVDVPGLETDTPRVDVPGLETDTPRIDIPGGRRDEPTLPRVPDAPVPPDILPRVPLKVPRKPAPPPGDGGYKPPGLAVPSWDGETEDERPRAERYPAAVEWQRDGFQYTLELHTGAETRSIAPSDETLPPRIIAYHDTPAPERVIEFGWQDYRVIPEGILRTRDRSHTRAPRRRALTTAGRIRQR